MWKQTLVAVAFITAACIIDTDQCAAKDGDRRQAVNVVFGLDPGPGQYNAVVGKSRAAWNLVDVGQTKIRSLVNTKGKPTSCQLHVSENDGEWGIADHTGVYHAYIYHNQQNVDLQAKFKGLVAGNYRVYVYAHGDAPNQNSRVELFVGKNSIGSKATANDGTYRYRSMKLKEGLQYVVFDLSVSANEAVRVVSHRDGSSYSMFNAIQIVPAK
ncbi:MAG: hypothetical protein L7U72_03210 [Rubripirellula sp.]|nr:hypothetical protein [Rubripirellula sp.]